MDSIRPEYFHRDLISRVHPKAPDALAQIKEFRDRHQTELQEASSYLILPLSRALQRDLTSSMQLDPQKIRNIDPERGARLYSAMINPNIQVVFGRHGTQALNDFTAEFAGPFRKIAMMDPISNKNDPITPESFVEAAGMSMIYAAAQAHSARSFEIVTSSNARATIVAAILGSALRDAKTYGDPRLDCLIYPSSTPQFLTFEQINELLGKENNGSLPWKRPLVDKLCGYGTFDKIVTDTADLLSEGLKSPFMTIYLTHTQQTNAIDEMFGDPPTRYSELGLRVIGKDAKQTILMNKSIFEDLPLPVQTAA